VWIFYPWSLSETLYELAKDADGGKYLIDKALELMHMFGVETELIDLDHLSKSLKLYLRRG